MTLILTCLAHEHIVQVADRRLTMPNGSLCDDDTNKAVFYCGRVAVAYTGLARMEGMPTAEWIGSCMKDAEQTESAMSYIAERAERHLNLTNLSNKRLVVVAAGWATFHGAGPLRPFMCVASNFMNDFWKWERFAGNRMVVRTRFLDEDSSHIIFASGQALTPAEEIYLNRLVRRAVAHGVSATAVVRVLGNMVQSLALGTDGRALSVGKGMIIHLLSRKAVEEGRTLIVTPLARDTHSFIYVSPAGRTDPFQGAVIACKRALLTNVGGGSIPPGGKGVIRSEMEKSARQNPIKVPSGDRYSSVCPFCKRQPGSTDPPRIVQGELLLTDTESWVHCGGETGHLLLIQRAEA